MGGRIGAFLATSGIRPKWTQKRAAALGVPIAEMKFNPLIKYHEEVVYPK